MSEGECAQLIRQFAAANQKRADSPSGGGGSDLYRRPANIATASGSSGSSSVVLSAGRDLSLSTEWARRVLTTMSGQTLEVQASAGLAGAPSVELSSGTTDNESASAFLVKSSDIYGSGVAFVYRRAYSELQQAQASGFAFVPNVTKLEVEYESQPHEYISGCIAERLVVSVEQSGLVNCEVEVHVSAACTVAVAATAATAAVVSKGKVGAGVLGGIGDVVMPLGGGLKLQSNL